MARSWRVPVGRHQARMHTVRQTGNHGIGSANSPLSTVVRCAQFDGVDDFLVLKKTVVSESVETISFWLNIDDTAWVIPITSNGITWTILFANWFLYYRPVVGEEYRVAFTVSAIPWYKVEIIRDGTSCEIKVDGTVLPWSVNTLTANSKHEFDTIGKRTDSEFLHGKIDDFKVYSWGNINLWLKMSDASWYVMRDSSGNKNHAGIAWFNESNWTVNGWVTIANEEIIFDWTNWYINAPIGLPVGWTGMKIEGKFKANQIWANQVILDNRNSSFTWVVIFLTDVGTFKATIQNDSIISTKRYDDWLTHEFSLEWDGTTWTLVVDLEEIGTVDKASVGSFASTNIWTRWAYTTPSLYFDWSIEYIKVTDDAWDPILHYDASYFNLDDTPSTIFDNSWNDADWVITWTISNTHKWLLFNWTNTVMTIPNSVEYMSGDWTIAMKINFVTLPTWSALDSIFTSLAGTGTNTVPMYVKSISWGHYIWSTLGWSAINYTNIDSIVAGVDYDIFMVKEGNNVTVHVWESSETRTRNVATADWDFKFGTNVVANNFVNAYLKSLAFYSDNLNAWDLNKLRLWQNIEDNLVFRFLEDQPSKIWDLALTNTDDFHSEDGKIG